MKRPSWKRASAVLPGWMLGLTLGLVAVGEAGFLIPEAEAGPRARGGAPHSVSRGGGGGGRAAASRPSAGHQAASRPSGTRPTNPGGSRDFSGSTNRDVNRDVNRNVNRDVNIDRDIDIDVDHDWDNDWDHPFATAAAVTAGVALTSAVIGSMVYSLPPDCVTVVNNGITYRQCGSAWYQPQYAGTTVQYVVVSPPY